MHIICDTAVFVFARTKSKQSDHQALRVVLCSLTHQCRITGDCEQRRLILAMSSEWHCHLSRFLQLQSVLRDRASVGVGQQHPQSQEERRNHETLERVSDVVDQNSGAERDTSAVSYSSHCSSNIQQNTCRYCFFSAITTVYDSLPLLLSRVQPAVDWARLQQRHRLSFQVLRPLALQTVPRRRGGQRRCPQRHLCQLQWFRPGGRERQLPVRFSRGTREKGEKEGRNGDWKTLSVLVIIWQDYYWTTLHFAPQLIKI